MFRAIDNLLLRFEEAYHSLKNPDRVNESFNEGKDWGERIGYAKVRQQFDTFDPAQFSNNHFKLGYYYATEQAKQVMQNDEDNSLD